MISELTLSEWVKMAQHREEVVKVYLVNHNTKEVVACSMNPNFIVMSVRIHWK